MSKTEEFLHSENVVERHILKESAPLVSNDLLVEISDKLDDVDDRLRKSEENQDLINKKSLFWMRIAAAVGFLTLIVTIALRLFD